MNVQKNTKGFTIIEVVLVLAIAALIFLMIFIALPALQRGQRDTARKQDIGTIAAAVNDYTSNHRGNTVPVDLSGTATVGTLGITNLSQIDTDKVFTYSKEDAKAPTDKDAIYVVTTAVCGDDNKSKIAGASKRQSAIVGLLESGSLFCQDV